MQSRGIGGAIALELAGRGANITVCCQSRPHNHQVQPTQPGRHRDRCRRDSCDSDGDLVLQASGFRRLRPDRGGDAGSRDVPRAAGHGPTGRKSIDVLGPREPQEPRLGTASPGRGFLSPRFSPSGSPGVNISGPAMVKPGEILID